jgi:hypothetical protein
VSEAVLIVATSVPGSGLNDCDGGRDAGGDLPAAMCRLRWLSFVAWTASGFRQPGGRRAAACDVVRHEFHSMVQIQ